VISRSQMLCLVVLLLLDVVAGFAVVGMFPDRFSGHVNASSADSRVDSPWGVVCIAPVTTLFAAGVMVLTSTVGAYYAKPERGGMPYGRAVVAGVAGIVALHLILGLELAHGFRSGRTEAERMTAAAQYASSVGLVVVGVLLMTLGSLSGRIRRNIVVGIRTPATLQSEAVWQQTNRVGSRFTMGLGVAIILATMLAPFWIAIPCVITGVLGMCLGGHFYSRSLARAEARSAAASDSEAGAK
jgi:uncharacterized membrane protein